MPRSHALAFTTALALCATLALPARADLTQMSDADRAAFRDEVRAYLLDNPEVLMEAIGVLEQRQAEAKASGDVAQVAANIDALTNDGYSHVVGNPDGDVTVVEFLDYRCAYCKKAHPEVAELLARDGNIRLIVKEFPILGDESVFASRFAIATGMVAGDAAYEAVSNGLMEMRGTVNEASVRALAKANDLDADAILARTSDPEIDAIISKNRALAQTLNINGTPSFVFGDQMVRGYVPLDTMNAIVAEVRKNKE